MKAILFLIVLLSGSSFAENRVPRLGASSFGVDDHGKPVYLLQDLLLITKTVFESPLIYNGTRSVSGEFLPMGWIGNCTGTAVGPKVIFTAAHCVTNGKRITFTSRFDGQRYAATCTRHPQVNPRNWFNDYAYCKLDSEFPKDMVYASFLNELPARGEDLLLNGFGAPNVGVHYWGKASVNRYGSQDIYTCGPANLGGGDSGGSLLKWSNDRSGKSGFKIVGVNSRGGGGCSLFNRVADSGFQNWSTSYSSSQGVGICGITLDCIGATPPDPEPPVNCWQAYEEFAFCIGTKGKEPCIDRAEKLKSCVE